MTRLFFLFAATLLLCDPASATRSDDDTFPSLAEKSLIKAIYSRGRKQVMEADISPMCRQRALMALAEAAAADSHMKCDSIEEKAEDVGEILLAVWESLGSLMEDVNTVVNGIPICFSGYRDWNPMKITCFFTNFWPVWNAVKHVLHYNDFWMNPYHVMKEFASCISNKKSMSTKNVKMILKNARFCN